MATTDAVNTTEDTLKQHARAGYDSAYNAVVDAGAAVKKETDKGVGGMLDDGKKLVTDTAGTAADGAGSIWEKIKKFFGELPRAGTAGGILGIGAGWLIGTMFGGPLKIIVMLLAIPAMALLGEKWGAGNNWLRGMLGENPIPEASHKQMPPGLMHQQETQQLWDAYHNRPRNQVQYQHPYENGSRSYGRPSAYDGLVAGQRYAQTPYGYSEAQSNDYGAMTPPPMPGPTMGPMLEGPVFGGMPRISALVMLGGGHRHRR